ncbi:MAG: histidinol-phosphatase HisJ [Candidatus Lokiarchaeota archaeon]|nr:histidinol-phosphatase HisJ [Candidatus Lokiarchaeota archaeon]
MLNGLFDAHVHTKLCRHATGEMYEYVEYAKKIGLDMIYFSDHFPMFYLPEEIDTSTYCMRMDEIPVYLEEIKNLNEKYPDYEIKIAMEVDFIKGKNKIIKNAVKKYQLDYILGSVHIIDNWCFDDPENLSKYDEIGILDIYTDYFHTLKEAIDSKLFDVMAHLDLAKKFGFRPDEDIEFLIDPIIKSLKRNDVCIELNTAGSRKPVGEYYPSRDILEKCYENDIPILLGSDAHKPQEVGWKFQEALDLIKEIGFIQLVKFTNRKREYIDI